MTELTALELQPLHTTDVVAGVQRALIASTIAATTVYADPAVLRAVLERLVDHAHPAPELAIIAEPTAVLFRVSDRGPGVPSAERDARIEVSLAFCRHAVEAFGGRIWIEDNAPRGAVYCFLLPTGN